MWQRVSAVYTTLARGTGSLKPRMSSRVAPFELELQLRLDAPPPGQIVGCGDRAGRIPPNFFAISHTVLKCNPYQSPCIESSRVPVKNIERSSRCQYTQRARGRGGARYARVNIRARGRTSRAPPRARFDWYTGTLREFGSISNFGDWEPLLAPTGALGGISCWICLEKELMPGLFLCQVAGTGTGR